MKKLQLHHKGLNKSVAWVRNFWLRIDLVTVFILAASLAVRAFIPPSIFPNTPNDDFLGVKLTKNLLDGNWLGDWNSDILSKPPAYSFLLFLLKFIPLEVTLSVHAIYLIAALMFSKELASFARDRSKHFVKPIIFLIFAFNPTIFGSDFSRVYRTSLAAILSLIFIWLNLKLIKKFNLLTFEKNVRNYSSYKSLFYIVATLGFIYGFFILTRSEGFWILVGPIFVYSYFLIKITQDALSKKSFRDTVIVLSLIPLAFISYLLPITTVSLVNKSVYGVYEIENYYSGSFAKALKKWSSVEEGRSNLPFISISTGQRNAVYKVSPTAALLKPILENNPGKGWKYWNCSTTGICDDSGAWLPWEIRDAATQVAKIQNEIQFQAFFERIAQEIETGCKNETLKCNHLGLAPGVKSLSQISKTHLLDSAAKAMNGLIEYEQASVTDRPNFGGSPELLATWHSVINFRYITTENEFDTWRSFAHFVQLDRKLYQSFTPLLLLILLLFVTLRKVKGPLLIWQLSSFVSLFAYVGGMGIFEVSLGSQARNSLYGIPAQPIFLALISSTVILIANNLELKKLND
jgi:hypothetical protein